MWVEKYRPKKLADVVDQKEIIGSIEALLKNAGEMPHLLFSGSAGVGKTTTALCIARQVLGPHIQDNLLELNASDERGIGMVRDKVKRFSNFAAFEEIPFKIIILDEADEMTADAQTALRRTIEDASKICRFIIVANNISKIIDPIQSRCAVYKFTSIPEKEAMAQLKKIAKGEKASIDEEGLKEVYEQSEGDLRHAINILQAAASSGAVTAESVRTSAGQARKGDVDGILKRALAGDLSGARERMVELIKVYGMSESDFLKYVSAAVFRSGAGDPGAILRIIAEYDYRILSGANPEIQLSAMLAELGSLGK
ncbi:replication factor C small subunit [Cenarchaeum symbiosum A]|uniref:Replication factor C small subunit n=1 Tax=Cenarchaeum symbiosum (strain A) TaxID=414004 RepID=A0RYC0_CENSY|nr:replication factor C small subunit [Cenarchaeum symbiosum A]